MEYESEKKKDETKRNYKVVHICLIAPVLICREHCQLRNNFIFSVPLKKVGRDKQHDST